MELTNKLRLFIVVLLFNHFLVAQTNIQYSYDANGNRTQRKLVVCNNCPQSGRQISAAEEKQNQETASALGLSVFPNPTHEKVNVAIENLKDNEAIILVIDAQGKSLLDKKTSTQQNEVDMSPYKSGVYFIKVVVGKESLFFKVMKL